MPHPLWLVASYFWFVPWHAWRFAKRKGVRWRWALTGFALGASVVPGSFALYAFYFFIPVIGPILGIPGLALLLVHTEPLEKPLQSLGLMDFDGVQPLAGVSSITMASFAALVWGPVYGLAGAVVDLILGRTRRGNFRDQ